MGVVLRHCIVRCEWCSGIELVHVTWELCSGTVLFDVSGAHVLNCSMLHGSSAEVLYYWRENWWM